ncbi:MAG: hypothetical protein LBT60_01850 [Oscillospiraceae bacterium]|jgi:hypothetical protein|nr:hypothetical protein [Oscillospiraceae bacterium]
MRTVSRGFLAALLCLVTATACQGGETLVSPEVSSAEASAGPSGTPTPSPSAAPTPTPAPSPTPAPLTAGQVDEALGIDAKTAPAFAEILPVYDPDAVMFPEYTVPAVVGPMLYPVWGVMDGFVNEAFEPVVAMGRADGLVYYFTDGDDGRTLSHIEVRREVYEPLYDPEADFWDWPYTRADTSDLYGPDGGRLTRWPAGANVQVVCDDYGDYSGQWQMFEYVESPVNAPRATHVIERLGFSYQLLDLGTGKAVFPFGEHFLGFFDETTAARVQADTLTLHDLNGTQRATAALPQSIEWDGVDGVALTAYLKAIFGGDTAAAPPQSLWDWRPDWMSRPAEDSVFYPDLRQFYLSGTVGQAPYTRIYNLADNTAVTLPFATDRYLGNGLFTTYGENGQLVTATGETAAHWARYNNFDRFGQFILARQREPLQDRNEYVIGYYDVLDCAGRLILTDALNVKATIDGRYLWVETRYRRGYIDTAGAWLYREWNLSDEGEGEE